MEVLGEVNNKFWPRNKKDYFSINMFSIFCDRNPGTGSALAKNAGSGSALQPMRIQITGLKFDFFNS